MEDKKISGLYVENERLKTTLTVLTQKLKMSEEN